MKSISGLICITLMIGTSGCSTKKVNNKYLLNQNKIDSFFEAHKSDKSHKAIAATLGDNNKFTIGYAHDAESQESAKLIAIKHCIQAHKRSNSQNVHKCEIYTVDNQIIRKISSK